jgi:hypothetical protein
MVAHPFEEEKLLGLALSFEKVSGLMPWPGMTSSP